MKPTIAARLRDDISQRAASDRVDDDMAGGMVNFREAPASNYAAGERGQQAVAIAERMRTAARMSELEDQMRTTQITKSLQEDTPGFVGPPSPVQTPRAIFTGDLNSAALQTVDFEGRKDKAGNLAVYQLPSGDMGGSYEVAGINNRYHPKIAEALKNMDPALRRDYAARYIVDYTSPLTSKLPETYRPFFQDLAFNRGMAGATKFLQRAVGAKEDGLLGPKTLELLAQQNPRDVLRQVSLEQLNYERRLAEQNPERKKFLPGLENRIRNRLAIFGQI